MKTTAKIHYLKRSHLCPHCVFRGLLSTISRDQDHLSSLADDATRCHGPFKAGDYIYRAGNPFRSLKVVQKGAVKTEILSMDGTIDVSGFFLIGDMFGFDAIGSHEHCVDAVALSDTWVCEMPFSQLEALCLNAREFQSEVFGLLGRIIRRESHELRLIRSKKSEQRVLWFLNDLQQRIVERRGDHPGAIQLPMLKDDVAKYLGLTRETLSRILTSLDRNGLIRNHTNSFEILDVDTVRQAAAVD